MESKDHERAKTGEEKADRKTVDEEKLESIAAAAVPISIEVGESGSTSSERPAHDPHAPSG